MAITFLKERRQHPWRWREREKIRETALAVIASLTSREKEIAYLVSDGLRNKEIARRLGIDEGTVKIHLHNIYRKAQVSNRTALVALVHGYTFQRAS